MRGEEKVKKKNNLNEKQLFPPTSVVLTSSPPQLKIKEWMVRYNRIETNRLYHQLLHKFQFYLLFNFER